jgi:hypothetical protein
MNKVFVVRSFIGAHWLEIVLAIAFAIFVDFVGVGSYLRAGVRHLKNKLSERSVGRLRKRIKELERLKAGIETYLTSDKALYLATFRCILVVLLCIVTGLIMTIADRIDPRSSYYMAAFVPYGAALAIVVHGLKISSLDTRAKIIRMVAGIMVDTTRLRMKLERKLETAKKS